MLCVWNCILALLLFSHCYGYKTFKNILVADDTNFEDLIHEKGKYTFINFYSRQCQHCQKLAPKYEPLTELFNNTKVQIAQVEGRDNKRIRKQEHIAGFPTLRLYAFDGTHIASYVGDRSTEDMANFINAHTGVVPNWPDLKVIRISTKKELDSYVKSEENVILAFISPWLENWIGKISFIERLALKKPEVKFLVVDATSEEATDLSSLYKVDNYPTIFQFKKNSSKGFKRLKVSKEDSDHGGLIEKFLDGEIGETYDSLKDLEFVKTDTPEEADNIQRLQKGFNVGVQRELTPEQEEESYKRLREL